ncbi:MAG: preprotein translocase subunit YajC [Alphaproteobacteria bacterium]|nr:preprotein translocase subunit YajC [Alphaproteobacteria bacterium]
MFINSAFAAANSAAQTTSGTSMIVQLVLIMAVFYLFLIRPQQKKMKQHEQMLQTIKKGDKIITGGGIVAKVTDASDPFELAVEIANGVEIKVYRATVRELLKDEDVKNNVSDKVKKTKPANANKKSKK